MSDGIVEFIKTQLDSDEAGALAAAAFYDNDPEDVTWRVDEGVNEHGFKRAWLVPHLGVINDPASARHMVRYSPAAVLAEIEAKRYLLEWCAEVTQHFDWSTLNQPASLKNDPNARATHTAVVALQSMAAPYIGRPGFKPEWRLP